MAEFEKKVRAILSEHGCAFHRHGKGDHDIWFSPLSSAYFTVDGKIKSRHTANAIRNLMDRKVKIIEKKKGALAGAFRLKS